MTVGRKPRAAFVIIIKKTAILGRCRRPLKNRSTLIYNLSFIIYHSKRKLAFLTKPEIHTERRKKEKLKK